MSYRDISEEEQRAWAGRVRAFRLRRYWTIRQMAAAAGLGHATIDRLKACQDKPKAATVLRIERLMEKYEREEPELEMKGLEGIW